MNDLTAPDFDELLLGLEKLSRNHLLFFRIEAGKLIVRTLWGGDRARMRVALTVRDGVYQRFVVERAEALEGLGLNPTFLRQCLHAWAVVDALPKDIAQKLQFSHVVELTRVEDEQTRDHLARATVQNDWSTRALRDAVKAVEDQRWIDGDPVTPGLQPPAPVRDDPDPPVQPGRVVTRAERVFEEVDELVGQWESIDVSRLSKPQRERARVVVEALKERVARLEARLG